MKHSILILIFFGLLHYSCSVNSQCHNKIEILEKNITICLPDSTWSSESDNIATYLTKYSESEKPIFVLMIKEDKMENNWNSKDYRDFQLEEYESSLPNYKFVAKGEINSLPYSKVKFDMISESDTLIVNSQTLFYKKGTRAILFDSWYLNKNREQIDFSELDEIWKSIQIN